MKLRIPICILSAVIIFGIFAGNYTANLNGIIVSYSYRDLLLNSNGNAHFHATAGL